MTPGFLRASSTLLARAISALDDESHARPLRNIIDVPHFVGSETTNVSDSDRLLVLACLN